MKLLVKQRAFSWTDSYDVYDENENAKYFVKAEFLSLGHRLHVYDMAGNELGLIKEKVMSLLPVFEIEVNGQTLGRIEKRFTLFRPKYDVEFNGWHVEGDSWDGIMISMKHAVLWYILQKNYSTGEILMYWILQIWQMN